MSDRQHSIAICMAILEQAQLRHTVRHLRAGHMGIITGIIAEHLSAKRLADMGFVTGARIRMIRSGDPCIVGIGGTFVGLGAGMQDCVLVSQGAAGTPGFCCGPRMQECSNGS